MSNNKMKEQLRKQLKIYNIVIAISLIIGFLSLGISFFITNYYLEREWIIKIITAMRIIYKIAFVGTILGLMMRIITVNKIKKQ